MHRLLPHSVKPPLRILPLWFTADHGGHDRTHGTDSPEDMTIPFIIKEKNFKVGEKPWNVSIKDIAPTAAKLLDIVLDQAWEGKSLV